MSKPDVIIVGAGLSGLCCARHLQKQGVSFQILEAADDVGGRIRTDEVEGFRLDRGFQVLLTAYPEAEAVLDYEALSLCAFAPAVMVRALGRMHRIVDPWTEGGLVSMLLSGMGTIADRFRLSRLRNDVMSLTMEDAFARVDMGTRKSLMDMRNFSPRIIEELFRPVAGAMLFDPQLSGSSRMFEYVLSVMATGQLAVPEFGMGEIPKQLARSLPEGSIRLNVKVASVDRTGVKLATGEELASGAVVIATEGQAAMRLLKLERTIPARSACCVYFAAEAPPIDDPITVLSGGSRGLVNHLAVMSNVSAAYAPKGKHLISVTVRGFPTRDDAHLTDAIVAQLKRWFGTAVDDWRVLKTYRIERALPAITPLGYRSNPKIGPELYVCGDHRSIPSIQGAMESGRMAAEALVAEMRGEANPYARVPLPVVEAT